MQGLPAGCASMFDAQLVQMSEQCTLEGHPPNNHGHRLARPQFP
jgi:hypothetical protein